MTRAWWRRCAATATASAPSRRAPSSTFRHTSPCWPRCWPFSRARDASLFAVRGVRRRARCLFLTAWLPAAVVVFGDGAARRAFPRAAAARPAPQDRGGQARATRASTSRRPAACTRPTCLAADFQNLCGTAKAAAQRPSAHQAAAPDEVHQRRGARAAHAAHGHSRQRGDPAGPRPPARAASRSSARPSSTRPSASRACRTTCSRSSTSKRTRRRWSWRA